MKEKIKQITNTKQFHMCMVLVIIVAIIFVAGVISLRYNVEGEGTPPFTISKVSIISSVDGTDVEGSEEKWNLKVNQNNDIYLYIKKNEDYKYTETIADIKLENFNITQSPKVGQIKLLKPDADAENVIFRNSTENEINYNQDIIVALDDIQDPGNLGTILRTVDSIGLKQILVSKGTADSYNPKVVRSTMGAIFRVKIIECEKLSETLKQVKAHKYQVLATSLKTKNSIYDIDYNKKVIVIGNEANGVSEEILKLADIKVKIPMLGKTESLNASVATGIMLYEYVRQKIKK